MKVMLSDFMALNPGASINPKKMLLAVSKNGNSVPSTIWKVNFMVCT